MRWPICMTANTPFSSEVPRADAAAGTDMLDDPVFGDGFARAAAEARFILARMREIADRNNDLREKSAKVIQDSWAWLRKY